MPDDPPPPFQSPPSPLVRRKAKIQLGETNTLRYPGDPEHPDSGPWFAPGAQRSPTSGNDVEFLVEGTLAIPAMFKAIDETGTDPTADYVFMLNWFADPFISPAGPWGSLGALLAKKLGAGVQVRGMYFRPFSNFLPWPIHDAQNDDMVAFLNRGRVEKDGQVIAYLPKGTPAHSRRLGAAIHDSRLSRIHVTEMLGPIPIVGLYASVGSHHQKVLCVKAGGKLTTFCGGIDFNPDRLTATGGGAPLHDVHCRVQGPTSAHLVNTFVQRWTDHPDSAALDAESGPLRTQLPANATDVQPAAQASAGRHQVQVGRTVGTGPLLVGHGGQDDAVVRYAFAPGGETSARVLVRNAIQSAKKFIYIEDQYFVILEAAQLIAQALQNGIAHVTLVVPHHKIGDLPLMVRHRRQCIQIMRDADPSGKRVRVFYKCGPGQTPGDAETYVHSKLTIVDDEFAVVGSVNYNRRSWYYDSEINIGVYDPSTDLILTNRFARWLRMRMWAEHLFGVASALSPAADPEDYGAQYAELFDGVAAGAHWLELIELQNKWQAANPSTPSQKYDQSTVNTVATVRPYDLQANDPPDEIYAAGNIFPLKFVNSEYGWDTFLDPQRVP